MKNLFLSLFICAMSLTSVAQDQTQHIQDVMNIAENLSDSSVNYQDFHAIPQAKLNGSSDVVEAGQDGIFFLRFRAVAFVGVIGVYYKGRPVMQLTSSKGFDTGDVFVICDYYDAIGIDESSGTVTVEGYKYTPQQ